MPIKLPKGFPRRKASGNALEELPNPPEPSFRVFERPGSKSFDGGETLKRMSLGRPLSAGHSLEDNLFVARTADTNPHNRGSGGTNNSSSSGGQNDNSSASARFSSSSTLPSSTDASLDDKPLPNPRGSHDSSMPPVPESNHQTWRNKSRTFSFGRRRTDLPASASQPDPVPAISEEFKHVGRERALTESSYASGSTATPPKLLGGELDFGESDLDGFGSMFESIGKRKSQLLESKGSMGLPNTESPETMSPTSRNLTRSYFGERSLDTPAPLKIDRSQEVESSPYSWGSHDSQDGLMSSQIPTTEGYNARYNDSPPVPRHGPPQTPSRKPVPESTSPSSRTRQQRPPSSAGSGLRRSSAVMSRRDSAPYQDEDARLVLDSISASRRLNRSSTEHESIKERSGEADYTQYNGNRQAPPAGLFDSSDSNFQTSNWRMGSTETTPRAKKVDMVQPEEQGLFDDFPPTSARMAAPRQDQHSQISAPPKKVMTPAQFERYRREQEMTRAIGDTDKGQESDEDSDNYDDDDETERNKQLAKQRRKQEAHLAVYRQQMMKVTGEQPSDLPNIGSRPGMERAAMSTPNLTPMLHVDKASRGKASDDEDEDVPLGILAAHGFPTKNRPPTAGAMGSGPIKYTSESYPPPPMSSAGSTAGGPRGLPPFARNLPPDPYFGAGLVNQPNREALRPSGGSVYGGPSSPNVHPGGLVGVIAGEERAKALRRGSPNAHGGWGSPLPQGMPQMPTPGMNTPGDDAQAQISQQMTQMMQMQMQWMQQMQQMMAGGGMQGPPPGQQPPQLVLPQPQSVMGNGFLTPPGQMPRPVSHSAPASPGVVQAQQRAMSMMPSTSQWPGQMQTTSAAPSMMGGQGYAPSIAPSERSNVGMAPRYRPVSIAPMDEHSRPSSRSTMLQPPDNNRKSSASSHLRVMQQPSRAASGDDDDDEEGWEEMMKKRESKKSTWKLKKKDKDQGLGELYYPGPS